MIEAPAGRPGWQIGSPQFAKALLEPGDISARVRIARRNRAARAGIAALKIDFANAEAHGAAFFPAEELVFPERRNTIDFQSGAKAEPHVTRGQAREPGGNRIQGSGRNNGWTAGDGVVRKAFERIADGDLLLEVRAEPFGGASRIGRKRKRTCGNAAPVAWNRERHGSEIGSVRGANQVDGRSPFSMDPLPVRRVERPCAIQLKPAARADARFFHRNWIQRLNGMKLDMRQARRNRR